MKLCVVKNQDIGLSETFIRVQIEGLPAEVSVIHGSPPRLEREGAEPLYTSAPVRASQRLSRRFNKTPAIWHKHAAEYTYLLKASGAEVVLAQYGTTGVLVMEACKRLGLPLVVHFHGYDASRTSVLEELGEGYRLLFQRASALIVVSRKMRSQLLELGAPPDKLVLNPYSVDVEMFTGGGLAASDPTFLAVGRLVEKKAPHLLLLAFAEVHRRYPAARLRLIGDGELWNIVQELVGGLGLEDVVELLGAQPHDVVRAEMQRVRAFVQHSVVAASGDSEGMPNSILEAGASGLPVVSTDHAGIPDAVVDGETGFVVPERDVKAMAERMLQLAEDPLLAERMGKAARRHISALFGREERLGRLWAVMESAYEGYPLSPELLRDDMDPASAELRASTS